MYSAAWAPPTKSINTINKGATVGSPARRLLVDLNVSFGRTDWDTAGVDREFSFDLTQAMFANLQSYGNDPSKWREVALNPDGYLVKKLEVPVEATEV